VQEGTFINLSLTTLGRVIDDISRGRKTNAFRDSKLTQCARAPP
jgi:hypothetical protein